MPDLNLTLLNYLETLTGTRPVWMPVSDQALPLFLRNRFTLGNLELFGQMHRFALERRGTEPDSPGGYEKQSDLLRQKLGCPVVLGIAALPAFARNRLVQHGVPFVVPGSQLFLPPMLVDLRERFTTEKKRAGRHMTPAAQCVLLYHLQKAPLDNLPLREIARIVGYTPMMLTKVKDEFITAGLAEAREDGRSVALVFKGSRRVLWDMARHKLTSPVKKTHWVQWTENKPLAPLAGLTALSARTDIGDDSLRTHALNASEFRKELERGRLHTSPDKLRADAKLETWSYDPKLLGDIHFVDPLSLYLSLRESPDERIRQQLTTLIDGFPW